MTTRMRLTITVVLGALALATIGLAPGGPGFRRAPGVAPAAAGEIDDLLMDLQLVPMDGKKARPFSLEGLDGRRVALGDVAGRPALLYFWATW